MNTHTIEEVIIKLLASAQELLAISNLFIGNRQ